MDLIKTIIFLLLFSYIGNLSAQQSYAYRVEFTDKENTIYTVENPSEYLSERAIERRNKYNIEITDQDFPVNRTYIDSILKFDATLHVTSRWFNSAVFYVASESFVIEVEKCSFVKEVTMVYHDIFVKSTEIQNKWNEETEGEPYGSSYNQIAMCNAQKLHENGYRGKGIQIAVLDGGFWRANEFAVFDSLFMNNRILSHWDFVDHNANVFDDDSHGMSVLSTMGGYETDSIIGSAPEASYHLFRTENVPNEFPIEEENYIAAAEVADSAGTDIITASLGYSEFDDTTMNYTYEDMDGKSTRITQGAEVAFSKGIFVVNSAGNSGNKLWHYITAPSDGENVLCVGAVDAVGSIADFSSRGPSFDGRVKPDVVAKGLGTTIIRSNGNVSTGNGTSFSGPVMAGMVACLWQYLPELSNKQLLDLIRSYGSRYVNPDDDYGYGLPDFGKVTAINENIQSTTNASLKIVYPNPFKENLNFTLFVDQAKQIDVVVLDAKGSKVYSKNIKVIPKSLNSIEINDLGDLKQGLYFLTIYTNAGMLSTKIVRN